MDLQEYQKLTSRTNTDLGSKAINAAHVTLGIVGEWEECIGANVTDIFFEFGDVMWYCSELANLFNIELLPITDSKSPRESIGWIAENVKKYLAYNREMDVNQLGVELCHLTFCVSDTLYSLNYKMEDCLDANITKLQKRFPEKFSAELAIAKGDEKQY